MFVFSELDTSLLRYKLKILLEGRALVLFWEFSEVQIKGEKEILSSSKNTLPTKTAFECSELWKTWENNSSWKDATTFMFPGSLGWSYCCWLFPYPTLKDVNRCFLTGQGQTSFMILCNWLQIGLEMSKHTLSVSILYCLVTGRKKIGN